MMSSIFVEIFKAKRIPAKTMHLEFTTLYSVYIENFFLKLANKYDQNIALAYARVHTLILISHTHI